MGYLGNDVFVADHYKGYGRLRVLGFLGREWENFEVFGGEDGVGRSLGNGENREEMVMEISGTWMN